MLSYLIHDPLLLLGYISCRTRHTKRRWLRHAAMVSVNVTSRLKPAAADGELLLHNIPLLIAMLNLRHELYLKKGKKQN